MRSATARTRSITWDQVRARRLARQHLLTCDKDVVSVARDVCGLHAQVQASAELQLAARVVGIVQEDVRRALWEQRSLVKAWTLRGTLHIHPADELALWYAALRAVAPTEPQAMDAWRDPNGQVHPALSVDDVRQIRRAVLHVLDGRCLRREELAEAAARHVSAAARDRLLSGFAFFGGADICQGPPQGSRITLARADQWVRRWKEADPRKALREVCRRFIATYGPVTSSDFGEWIGSRILKADAWREVFASLDLETVDVERREAFVLSGDTRFPRATAEIRLLSEYDVYVMGFREKDHLVPPQVKQQIAAHSRGKYEGAAGVRLLVIGGVAAGLWERSKRGKRIQMSVAPVRRLTRSERAQLEEEANRIGTFLGLEPELTVA